MRQPQFPHDLEQFRLADGTTKTISAVVRKTYQAITDQMHESVLQKMAIALVHDTVNIEGTKYAGGVALDGEFQITWQDFLDYPLGVANFTVQVSPFFETNNNCQTCEEATQLNLVNDEFYGDLDEGETATINVFTNDLICCSPITAEIVSFDSTYLESMTIDEETGDVTVTVNDPAPAGTVVKIGTYRVTCPNGGYDEADIYATIDGTIPTCEEVTALVIEDMDGDNGEATANWTPSVSSPADGYDWYLYQCENPTGAVQSGNVAGPPLALTGLIPGQCYILGIIGVCERNVLHSGVVFVEFTMPGSETNCERFNVINSNYPDEPLARYTYMDCLGNLQNGLARDYDTGVCMLVDSTNTPLYFVSNGPGLALYYSTGPCT